MMNSTWSFLLASVLTGYPDQDFTENIKVLISNDAVRSRFNVSPQEWMRFHRRLEAVVGNSVKLEQLRSEYLDLFDTVSDRKRFSANSTLEDIAEFYSAFELGPKNGSRSERLDHISVELEFYSILLAKSDYLELAGDEEGLSIVLDARRNFLRDHLGRLVSAIAARPDVKGSEFYSMVFRFCESLVDAECRSLGAVALKGDRAERHDAVRSAQASR